MPIMALSKRRFLHNRIRGFSEELKKVMVIDHWNTALAYTPEGCATLRTTVGINSKKNAARVTRVSARTFFSLKIRRWTFSKSVLLITDWLYRWTTTAILRWYPNKEPRSSTAVKTLKNGLVWSGMTHWIRMTITPQEIQHAKANHLVTYRNKSCVLVNFVVTWYRYDFRAGTSSSQFPLVVLYSCTM